MCPHTEVFEDCIGLYATDKTDAGNLIQLIKDVLVRLLFLWNVAVVSATMVLATCLVDILVLQHKSIRRNQHLSMFIAWDIPSILLYRILLVHSIKVMAGIFDTVLEMAKGF